MTLVFVALAGLAAAVLLAGRAAKPGAKAAVVGTFLAAAALYAAFGHPQLGDFSHHQQQQLLDEALAESGARRQEVALGLEKLAESLRLRPNDRQGWLALAGGYRLLNRAEESEQALLSGLRLFGQDAQFLRELGRLKMAQSRYGEALAFFDRSLKAKEEADTLRLALASAVLLGDGRAEELYRRRLEAFPAPPR